MKVLCLDLEGVLVPEIWQAVSETTGIKELQKTTRDIPIYKDLMDLRLEVMRTHSIGLDTITAIIKDIDPLPGARDFLDWARQNFQVAIISDTFYEFSAPLMDKLGRPMLLCHQLIVQGNSIIGYKIRQTDPKRASVKAFQALNYEVFAAGDSYNDVSMLEEADKGFFFRAPENVINDYQNYPLANSYDELRQFLS